AHARKWVDDEPQQGGCAAVDTGMIWIEHGTPHLLAKAVIGGIGRVACHAVRRGRASLQSCRWHRCRAPCFGHVLVLRPTAIRVEDQGSASLASSVEQARSP